MSVPTHSGVQDTMWPQLMCDNVGTLCRCFDLSFLLEARQTDAAFEVTVQPINPQLQFSVHVEHAFAYARTLIPGIIAGWWQHPIVMEFDGCHLSPLFHPIIDTLIAVFLFVAGGPHVP